VAVKSPTMKNGVALISMALNYSIGCNVVVREKEMADAGMRAASSWALEQPDC
jgi:hypothetical protein